MFDYFLNETLIDTRGIGTQSQLDMIRALILLRNPNRKDRELELFRGTGLRANCKEMKSLLNLLR